MKQTHLHTWKWRPNIELMHSNNRQELSTIKGPSALLHNFVRPRIYSPIKTHFGPTTLWQHGSLYAFIPLPQSLIYIKNNGVYAQACRAFLFKLNCQCCFGWRRMEMVSGKVLVLGKCPPFSISGMLIQLFIFPGSDFNKWTKQHEIPCIPCWIREV